jgi:two-component system LytT family sensor kinase
MYKMQEMELYVRWLGIPIVALIPYFFSSSEDQETYGFWLHWFHSIVFTGTYWNLAVWIFNKFGRLYPTINQTPKRLTFTGIGIVVMILVVTPLLKIVLGINTVEEVLNLQEVMSYVPVSITMSFMVGSVYEGVFFFDQWKESVKMTEALKNQQIRTQFEVLQNQMSPHFLFNSLNTLTTLIAEDQGIAINFTQKLSDVYRYILQNKERELVTLREEWDFAQDYLYLLKMRYPDNLHTSFEVDEKYLGMHIAPLTLQMLIENAIKHNVVSKSHPLTIEIYSEKGESIVVKNNIKPKQALEKSTKTGLMNIRKRYEYLGKRDIDVIQTAQHFMVAVPLITVEHSESIEEKSIAETA